MGTARWSAPLALSAVLAVVSWHTATNLGGTAGGVGYAAVITVITVVTVVVLPRAAERLRETPGALPAVVAGCLAVLALAFVLGAPPALHHALGVGSDRADALDVALARLADGSYPYTATTYLGNPITPLPGALVLAAPFWWATGDAAWQNPAWVVLLLAVVTGRRLRTRPVLLWALVVLGGLEVLREFLVGDDLVLGAVPALAAVALVLRVAGGRSTGAVAAVAVLLGVATCSRPHLVLVPVVVAVAVGATAGVRRALVVGGCAAAAWVVLVGPFLLGGVDRFSPLHVAAKVTGDRTVTAGMVVVAVAALAVLAVALWVARPTSTAAVGWFCAAVLFAPSLLSAGRGLLGGPGTEVDLTLGAAAVPFALWALTGSRQPAPVPPPTPGGPPWRHPSSSSTARSSVPGPGAR